MTRLLRRGAPAAALLLAALPGPPSAATQPAPPSPIRLSPTTHPVKVDGVLDEPLWQAAPALPLPWEWSPADNEPAPVETTVQLGFDAHNLYVAFRASDPEPSAIRAHYGDRDSVAQDDTVGFMQRPSKNSPVTRRDPWSENTMMLSGWKP